MNTLWPGGCHSFCAWQRRRRSSRSLSNRTPAVDGPQTAPGMHCARATWNRANVCRPSDRQLRLKSRRRGGPWGGPLPGPARTRYPVPSDAGDGGWSGARSGYLTRPPVGATGSPGHTTPPPAESSRVLGRSSAGDRAGVVIEASPPRAPTTWRCVVPPASCISVAPLASDATDDMTHHKWWSSGIF